MSTAILEFCFLLLVAATAQKYNYDEVDALRLFHLAASAYGDKQAECVYRFVDEFDQDFIESSNSNKITLIANQELTIEKYWLKRKGPLKLLSR